MKTFINIMFVIIFCGCMNKRSAETIGRNNNLVNCIDSLKLPERETGKDPMFTYITPKIFNFGTVYNDTVIEKDFIFANIGNYPLVIENCYTSCNCTALSLEKYLLLPGDSSVISLSLSTKN